MLAGKVWEASDREPAAVTETNSGSDVVVGAPGFIAPSYSHRRDAQSYRRGLGYEAGLPLGFRFRGGANLCSGRLPAFALIAAEVPVLMLLRCVAVIAVS